MIINAIAINHVLDQTHDNCEEKAESGPSLKKGKRNLIGSTSEKSRKGKDQDAWGLLQFSIIEI